MDTLAAPESRIFNPTATTKKTGKTIEAYYDAIKKEYLIKNAREGWIALNETQFKRILKQHKFSPHAREKGELSPLEEHLVYLQRNKDVYYVGPLAGHIAGFYEIDESRILVTNSPKIITPEKGEWPVLDQFLRNLFVDGDRDQRPYVYGWIKVAFEALRDGHHRPGQALVIAGPTRLREECLPKFTHRHSWRTLLKAIPVHDRHHSVQCRLIRGRASYG